MKPEQQSNIPAGWRGGFPPKDSPMLYPNPDLSSLPMLGNMDNIPFLKRQLGIKWPEFSWETEKDEKNTKRCFQMFAPYISRFGYTNKGRVYSIICPQQGVWIKDEICLNVEITVTGQRGWVNETTKTLAADMTVEAKVWFTPSEHQGDKFKALWPWLKFGLSKFPLDKENAIIITTNKRGDANQPVFPVRKGETTLFASPAFARHTEEAWSVGNIEVEIGHIKKTEDKIVDEFNTLVIDAINLASGNMLQTGNTLSWNLWFTEPDLVNTIAWKTHAERWRKSIDAHHGSPDGPGTRARYFKGDYFNADEYAINKAIQAMIKYIEDHR